MIGFSLFVQRDELLRTLRTFLVGDPIRTHRWTNFHQSSQGPLCAQRGPCSMSVMATFHDADTPGIGPEPVQVATRLCQGGRGLRLQQMTCLV